MKGNTATPNLPRVQDSPVDVTKHLAHRVGVIGDDRSSDAGLQIYRYGVGDAHGDALE